MGNVIVITSFQMFCQYNHIIISNGIRTINDLNTAIKSNRVEACISKEYNVHLFGVETMNIRKYLKNSKTSAVKYIQGKLIPYSVLKICFLEKKDFNQGMCQRE